MVYDGKVHYDTTKQMIKENKIDHNLFKIYRKRYPNMKYSDLINLINQKHNKNV